MASQVKTVPIVATDTVSVTFTKPASSYAISYGLGTNDGSAPSIGHVLPDVDNGDGTMTATFNLSGAVTGTLEIEIYDKL